ncbi:Spy/CpxP family protein refolding chaperone [Vampirovibrio sp.]|uniref:Spy/CpxP family protein refolding chaperone n=1 Tax=Vampirovibrio sp. TaxID=2717857 RepID=UPI0035947A3E
MKHPITAFLLAVTLMVGGLAPALADHHTGPHTAEKAEKKEKMKEDFFKEINATDDQKAKIQALDTQYRAKIDPLEKQMWDKKKSLMAYVVTPGSDKAQALQQEAELIEIKSQIGNLYIEQAYTQKSHLTPEQQKKAAAFYEEKAKKMKESDEY